MSNSTTTTQAAHLAHLRTIAEEVRRAGERRHQQQFAHMLDLLEAAAGERDLQLTLDQRMALSIAISLRRIADDMTRSTVCRTSDEQQGEAA